MNRPRLFHLSALSLTLSFLTAWCIAAESTKTATRPSSSKHITADMLTKSKGRLVVNVTKPGSVEFDAEGGTIDASQVIVRSSRGDKPLTALLGELPEKAAASLKSGKLRLGTAKSLRTPQRKPRGLPGGAVAFTCSPGRCDCHGDDDCNDMFGSGVCGDIAACWTTGGGVDCACLRY